MARPRRITVSGHRSFEYISQGRGPATLLVHPGGPGLTYHYLRPLLKLANAHLRVVLFNPRGVGQSWGPKSPTDYTIPQMAEDVEAIRRALHITELHLLGYSAGGFVALEYAHRYPARLTSLILCATAGSAEEIRQANRMVLACAAPRDRARLKELTREKAFHSVEYQALAAKVFEPFQTRFLKSESKDWKATKLAQPVYRAVMSPTGDEFGAGGTIAKWDGRKYYSKIEVPTLVVIGRYDFFLQAAVEMSDRIEPAHLRVLPHASHMVVFEQTPEFLKTIREFLEDVTGG